MKTRILVLGAGFGGLELSTILSEAFGDDIEVTLIDKSDSFYFGFSKLDVMFGHAKPNAVRLPHKKFVTIYESCWMKHRHMTGSNSAPCSRRRLATTSR